MMVTANSCFTKDFESYYVLDKKRGYHQITPLFVPELEALVSSVSCCCFRMFLVVNIAWPKSDCVPIVPAIIKSGFLGVGTLKGHQPNK